MDLAGNVGWRHGGAPANTLWPWALHLLSLFGGGREHHKFNLPSEYYGCDYYEKMPIDSTYYVFSPGYDMDTAIPKGIACRWEAEAPEMSHLELNCMDFKLGKGYITSKYCTNHRLLVSATGDPAMRDAEVHCGEGNFMITSARNKMTLVFIADDENDPMDRFLCSINSVRDEPPACDCGEWNNMRIVGGVEASVNEFPMMAGIVDLVIRRPYCGATIISRRYAVTAAHCFSMEDPDDPDLTTIGLLVGEHDVTTDEDTPSAKLYNIIQIIIHPNFKNFREGNDIALVKVDADGIEFSSNIGPVCLPFRYLTESFGGQRVAGLGWGATKFGEDTSDALMVAFLSVEPIQPCNVTFKGNINYGQICTYEEGSDTCQNDSGGPLLWLDQTTGRIHIIGIVSYGIGCDLGLPGINTRVTSFLDWIVLATNEEFCVA